MERRILGARGHKIWRKSGRILLSKSWDFVGGGGEQCPLASPLPLIIPYPLKLPLLWCLCARLLLPSPHSTSPHQGREGEKKPFLIPSSDSTGGYKKPHQCTSTSSSMALIAEAQFHVLAVDDSLLDRKLIERLLRTSSYQVTTVDSGSKALEFLGLQDEQSNTPSVSPYHQEIEVNLVITDYCMPGMTGYDLLKKIKETSSLKDIPVVIMSSENVPSRINRCLEEGAEEFFLKPVQLSDMDRLIPHMMKKKSSEQQKEGQMEQQQQPPQQLQIDYNNLCTAINTDSSSSNNSSSTGNSNSNKRKVMDEGLTPERTRPRCTVTA